MLKTTPVTPENTRKMPIRHRHAPMRLPNIPGEREVLPSPVILVVCGDGLLRWALYEALVAAHFRVLACNDEAHARELLPKVDAEMSVAIVDDETWPMTSSERTWLHARWPDLPIVVLAHHDQGLEHRLTELGLADVLIKPFDVSHLVQTIERLATAQVRTADH